MFKNGSHPMKAVVILSFGFLWLSMLPVSAVYGQIAPTIIADGEYLAGPGISPADGRELALEAARQAALRQAEKYIEKFVRLGAAGLAGDEARAVAAAVTGVAVIAENTEPVDSGRLLQVKIRAELDLGDVEKVALKVKQPFMAGQYQKIYKEYGRLARESSELSKRLAVARTEAERNHLTAQTAANARAVRAAALAEQAYRQHVHGRYRQAADLYTQAIELNSGNAAVYYSRGTARMAAGLYHQALNDFSSALAIDPSAFEAIYFRAVAGFAVAGPDKAAADLDKLAEVRPDFSTLLQEQYSHILSLNPSSSEAYFMRGVACIMPKGAGRQALENSLNEFSKALEIDPDYAAVYLYRSWLYVIDNRYDQALADIGRLIELDSRSAPAYLLRAIIRKIKQFEDTRLIPRQPGKNPANDLTGLILADLNQALELEPQYITAYEHRARLYELCKQHHLALADYQTIISLNPGAADAYKQRGNIFMNLGQYSEAIAEYSRACELDQRDIVAYMHRARAYERQKNLEKALLDYDHILKISPAYASAYYYKAAIYQQTGRRSEAVESLKCYLAYAKPNDPLMLAARKTLYDLESGR